jgi:hypothetical protein
MTLIDAQRAIATDWYRVYLQIHGNSVESVSAPPD